MDLPTIKVKAASGSGFVIINAEDFNGAKHVKWSEAPAPQAPPAKNEALTKPFEPPPVPELPKTEEPVPPVAQRRR